jgi:hypothetical protein
MDQCDFNPGVSGPLPVGGYVETATFNSASGSYFINGNNPFGGNVPTAPASAASNLYVDITPTDSYRGIDTAMTATATIAAAPPDANSYLVPLISLPSGTTTLQQAANDLGYSSITWSQQITIPAPSPYYACDNLACTSVTNITGTSYDPSQYGWTYCNPNSVNLVGVLTSNLLYDASLAGDCSTSSPYYPPELLTNGGSSLGFIDIPADSCLFNGSGIGCNGMTESSDTPLMFTTELVGEPIDDPNQPVDLFNFTWIDSFNGTAGGITPTTANLNPIDPGSGTGGITLEAVDGVPVPEPSTLTLLSASVLCFWLMRRPRQGI